MTTPSTLPPPPRPPLTTEQVVDVERNAAFDAEETAPALSFVRERALATLQLVAEWREQKADIERRKSHAQAWLERVMSRISEAHFDAAWHDGLEFALWHSITDSSGLRSVVLSEADITLLTQLSQDAGGWFIWTWQDTDPVFVTMEQWLPIFQGARHG